MRTALLVTLSVLAVALRLHAQAVAHVEPLPRIPVEVLVWDEPGGEFIAFTGELAGSWQWITGPCPAAVWSVSFADVTGWGRSSRCRYRIVTDFERWIPLADSYPQRIDLSRTVFVCGAGSSLLQAALRMHVTIVLAAPMGPVREVVTVQVTFVPAIAHDPPVTPGVPGS